MRASQEGRAVVMTIRVMSAGRGYEYLLKSVAAGDGNRDLGTPLTAYYTAEGTPPGTWIGSGLTGLGDAETGHIRDGDTVTEQHLERLLGAGVDPVTGSKLGAAYPALQPPTTRIAARVAHLDPGMGERARVRQVQRITEEEKARVSRTPVAGFDLTFSPPKSFSTLWGVADAGTQTLMAQAHHAALRDTLALLERTVAATRVGHGGVASMPVRGVIATAFDHYDTRAGDPQLHTHVVVSNKVQGIDGKWRTLDSRTLHKATIALSATYNAHLADHSTRLLGVTWTPVERRNSMFTGWEIDGVPAELVAEFSRRTLGVEGAEGIDTAARRLIDAYRETHGRSPSPVVEAKLRQQATLETRPDKQLHSLAELTTDWRERATATLGEDATTWATELLTRLPVDAILRADDLPLGQVHDLAAVVLMEVGNRRATWGRYNLMAEAARQTMGVRFATPNDRENIIAAIVERAEAESVRLTPEYDRSVPARFVNPDGTHWFHRPDTVAYTSRDILDAETRLLAHAADTTGSRLPLRVVNRHTTRPIRGVKLADDQAATILTLATSGRVLDVLVGPAGTGKTTALRALHRAWTAAHGRNSVIGLAPSAAAAEVLGDELGIGTENTAKFLHEHAHGRWNLKRGQLVLIDEASLAGTLALDRITTHAATVGAKVVLIGDHAQLSAVETGGAFGMLARTRDNVAELTDVRRFAAQWEKTASLGLRHGDPTVLTAYQEHGRIHDGDQDAMLDAAYTAWHTDRDAGLRSVMIAATAETVAALNARARVDLIAAGRVEESGIALHDGTTAGVGDVVVTRLNDRRLTTGSAGWVKNGDRWHVTGTFHDGSLSIRRLGKNDLPHGMAVVLPAAYVAASVELGYATTVHRAQGSTVDTAHAILDEATATRELLYVALTRGRDQNHVYIPNDQPAGAEDHHDRHRQERDGRAVLEQIMARTAAEPTATETLRLAVAEHASLRQLVAEYETIASHAQHDRWETLLESTDLTDAQLDRILDPETRPTVEAALRRGESNGYDVGKLVHRIAANLNHHERPAAALVAVLDRETGQPRGGSHPVTPKRVAGLIPIPKGEIPEDMRAALTEREHLIVRAARRLAIADIRAREPWTSWLGKAPAKPAEREAWLRAATTIRLYRDRHDITSTQPLGDPDQITDRAQAHDYRAASAAYQHTQRLTSPQLVSRTSTGREGPERGYGRSL